MSTKEDEIIKSWCFRRSFWQFECRSQANK